MLTCWDLWKSWSIGLTHLNLCMCSWTNYYVFLLFLKMDSVNTCHCQCLCPHIWLFTCEVGVALCSPGWSLSASQPLIKPQHLSRCSPPLSLFAASLLLCSLICLFARLNSLQGPHSTGFPSPWPFIWLHLNPFGLDWFPHNPFLSCKKPPYNLLLHEGVSFGAQ